MALSQMGKGTKYMTRFQDKVSPDWSGWIVFLFLINLIIITIPLLRGIMIHPDAPVYLWSAQSLEQGNIQTAIQAYPMLFYPFLVMCVHKLGLDWIVAGRIISVVASGLAVFPFFSLARRFSPGWPSILITTLFILLPQYNSIAFAALRDPIYICLALYCLYFAIHFVEKPELKAGISVILFSICLPLLRVEGIVVSLVILSWSFVVLLRHLNFSRIMWVIVGIIGFSCVLFYALKESDTFWQIFRFAQIVTYIQNADSTPNSVSYYLTILGNLAHNHVFSGPGNNFWQVIQRHWPWIYSIGMFYMFEKILGWFLVILGILGLRVVIKKHKAGLLLLTVFAANQLLIGATYVLTGTMEVRIMLFPAILWLLFAGAAFHPTADYLNKKLGIHLFQQKMYLIITLTMLLTLSFTYKTVFMKYRIHIPVLREACLWVRNDLLTKEKDWSISINMRRMAWFLDRKDALQNSPMNLQQILNFLSNKQQSAIVILLMSRRQEENVSLMKNLIELESISSKVFVDPNDKKNFVIAVWQKKEKTSFLLKHLTIAMVGVNNNN